MVVTCTRGFEGPPKLSEVPVLNSLARFVLIAATERLMVGNVFSHWIFLFAAH